MRPKLVFAHRLAVGDEPIKALDHRLEVAPQLRAEPREVGEPTHEGWDVLQPMRENGDGYCTSAFFDRRDAPRDNRCPPAFSADFEVVADILVPVDETAYQDETVEVVDLVVRANAGPLEDRVFLAKRVVERERAGARNDLPDFRWRCRDHAASRDGPFEPLERSGNWSHALDLPASVSITVRFPRFVISGVDIGHRGSHL